MTKEKTSSKILGVYGLPRLHANEIQELRRKLKKKCRIQGNENHLNQRVVDELKIDIDQSIYKNRLP